MLSLLLSVAAATGSAYNGTGNGKDAETVVVVSPSGINMTISSTKSSSIVVAVIMMLFPSFDLFIPREE